MLISLAAGFICGGVLEEMELRPGQRLPRTCLAAAVSAPSVSESMNVTLARSTRTNPRTNRSQDV
jgi:hypothetical protein